MCTASTSRHSSGSSLFSIRAFIFNLAELPCSTLHSFWTRISTHSSRWSIHVRCTTVVFAPGPSQAPTRKRALLSSPYGTSRAHVRNTLRHRSAPTQKRQGAREDGCGDSRGCGSFRAPGLHMRLDVFTTRLAQAQELMDCGGDGYSWAVCEDLFRAHHGGTLDYNL